MTFNVSLTTGDHLDLTGDFGEAYNLISNTTGNYFITGKAGTGKSTLLKYYVENSTRKLALLAPTGLAAINIGGQTIHSFFRFPPEPIGRQHIQFNQLRDLYKALEVIVIDEVSMVRADLMDGIDQMLRLAKGTPRVPFGGVQMLMFGDIFQLEPVVASKAEAEYFSSVYRGPFFFNAKVFDETKFQVIDIKKVFRQKDAKFIELLDSVRMDQLTAQQLDRLNQAYRPSFDPNYQTEYITLTTTNKIAREVNDRTLAQLTTPEFVFYGVLEGKFSEKNIPADPVLALKQGAQVMFLKNDINDRWVNGTIGRVAEVTSDSLSVTIENEGSHVTYDVSKATWETRRHILDRTLGTIKTEIVGTYTQYPVKLAWAITIHKSQGLTFDRVFIDFGSGAFAHGQAYVALSRCTNFKNLALKRPLRKGDIIIHSPVKRFYKAHVVNDSGTKST